ncbi:MAG: hypothetical protein BGO55_09325 [Sphingobacteriales bacterium 50-39]|nr:hypothetical protein [Sphingobacteriales bacterium]OJW57746.1 MAG: hypothetical protein BGO55_09325 [Sphingobacteriales bacterium 50-39]
MISPKDGFVEQYTEEETKELKMAFDMLTTYRDKVRFFDQYFKIDISGFLEQVERFEFPFPSQGRHSKIEVERLEMILSNSTVDHLLEKTLFKIPFSIHPTSPDDWFYFNRYLMGRKFVTLDSLKKAFWLRLAIVPEQEYFIQAQIKKFTLFDNEKRGATIPFHIEYYQIFQQDPDFRPHLNSWYTLFTAAYGSARKEGNLNVPLEGRLLYELYFTNLGFAYAHYLGFLKGCLVEIAEKGILSIPGQGLPPLEKEEKEVKEEQTGSVKSEFSHRSQILLLHRLGIFDLEIFKNLTDVQRGKLFGRLLNRNIDNTENYIRYRKGKNVDVKYRLENRQSVRPVEDLLRECSLENL